jgi:hypothetical protein
MNQYRSGKGGDTQFYLSAWNGEPLTIDRKSQGGIPLVIAHPYLTIVGGMTPDMLPSLSDGRDDGFTARLLFTYPGRTVRPYSEEGIPDAVADAWGDLCRSLWDRPMRIHEGSPVPHVVAMDDGAKRAWRELCQAHRAEQGADDFPASMEGAWGKLEAYAARLSLVLHMMALASDPTAPRADQPPPIPRRMIDNAWILVDYFKAHVRRVRASMRGRSFDGGDDVRWLLGWIIRKNLPNFTIKDVGNQTDRFRNASPGTLDAALKWLESRNAIRRPEAETGKPGRPKSPRYEVNPALASGLRFHQFHQNSETAPSFDGIDGNEGRSGVTP